MSFLSGMGLELGVGIAIGMIAGTTGTHGAARGRMTLLAAAIGVVVGILLAGTAELSPVLGAIFCALGAALACIVVSDVVHGAGRREAAGPALGLLVSLVAAAVAAAALLLQPLSFLALAALLWLGASRHRRAQRKHAGLRVLR